MPVTPLQKRIYRNGAICGVVLAVLITVIDSLGWLNTLENWLYDLRASTCQYFTPKPSEDIVYLDIDDGALDTIQRWPWDRSRVAAVLNELRLAKPKVVMLDIIYSEPQRDIIEQTSDEKYVTIEQDAALARAIKESGNVVMASSFTFQSAMTEEARQRAAAVEAYSKDIAVDWSALLDSLPLPSKHRAEARLRLDADQPGIRREAVRAAVRRAFDVGLHGLPAVQARLLPGSTDIASAASSKLRTLLQIVSQEFDRVHSERSLRRVSLDLPKDLRYLPAVAEYGPIPLPSFSESMAASGYADHRLFTDPVVRSLPLFVEADGRLYPQLALVTACKLLDLDVKKARVTDTAVTLPSPKGDVRIPVRAPYSDTVRRNIGLVMNIPWYGGRQWETMNDWPALQEKKQHYAIDSVWTAVEAQRRIDSNNARIDEYLRVFYGLYPSFKQPGLDRLAAADDVLKNLTELGFGEQLDPSQLKEDEKTAIQIMSSLRQATAYNTQLAEEIKQLRATNAQRFAGKAVLIGATATSTGDFATTSLHAMCPGVVVHGTIMNAIVNRDFLWVTPRWFNVLLPLAGGLIATVITCMLPPARGVFFLFLAGFAYFVTNGLLFYDRLNWVVDAAAPLVAMFVCWGGVLTVRTIVETLERLRLKQEAAVIDHEIELARQVQKGLIPKQLQVLPTVDSHGWTKAATTTGGDCFDLWKLKDGRMGILVGDASGHGLGPSLVVSQVRALVRSMCDLYENPQDLLNAVNLRLYEDLDGRKFCTCFLGFLSEDGKLAWASAGHGPMLWATTRDAPIEELNGTALPLGVSDDPGADEFISVLEMKETGWLAVTSDGIFEASDPKGEQFGVDRITAAIRPAQDGPSEAVVEALRKSVDAWQVKPLPDDDQTIVFLRRKAQSPAGPQN